MYPVQGKITDISLHEDLGVIMISIKPDDHEATITVVSKKRDDDRWPYIMIGEIVKCSVDYIFWVSTDEYAMGTEFIIPV